MKYSIILILFLVSCDYFQKKTYTGEDDRIGRLFELCIKAQTTDSKAGGNVMLCNSLLNDLTTSGKFENFKNCVDWEKSNSDKLKNYPEFDCFDIVYGD